ncbi:MAG TPA: DUF4239 domain-containing protein [Acidimicrobiales bacterium]|jgi:hypothetical protein|nr:DUF4239 domain-containing protein [Acidimicrobiales bacterium]
MSDRLVALNLWLLGTLLVVGIPLLVVAVQAAIRRIFPSIVEGEHNEVAGFLIAVVGVVYAVTLAFIVIVTWEEFNAARNTVDAEAAALRGVYRDTRALPEPAASQAGQQVVGYADEVSVAEWPAMSRGESSPAAFGTLGDMFATLEGVKDLSPTQETFLSDALVRLNDVAGRRSDRISAAAESTPGVLWAAIILGGIVTLGFALLFGVSNERLHYLMVGGFAAVLAVQVFVILVLSHPFAGTVRVSPEPFVRIVQDFR